MKIILKRKHVLLIVCLAYLIILVCLGRIFITQPYVGAEISQEGQKLVVDKVYPNSWAEKYLKVGDKVISNVKRNSEDLEGFKKVTILREKTSETFEVDYNQIPKQFLYQVIVPITFLFICLAYSIILIFRGKLNQAKIQTICFFIMISLGYFAASGSARNNFIAGLVSGLCLTITPFLLIHLLQYYFKKEKIRALSIKVICLAYVVSLLVAFMEILYVSLPISNYIPLMQLMIFGIGCIYMIWIMFNYYTKRKNSDEGPIIQIILLSLTVSFLPIILFYVLPTILLGRPILSADIAISFILVLPSALFYLNFKNLYFDVGFFIQRVKYYSLISLIPIILISLFSIKMHSKVSSLLLFDLLLIIGFNIFFFLNENLYHTFSKKHQSNYQNSLYYFTKETTKITNFKELVDLTQSSLEKGIVLNGVVLVRLNKESGIYKETIPCKYINKLYNHLKDQTIDTLDRVVTIDEELYLILGENEEDFLLFYVDRKKSKVKLNIEEKKWLNTLMYYAYITFENFKKMDTLLIEIEKLKVNQMNSNPWIAQLFCRISEKERSSIANEIHDNILQDLLVLYRQFERLSHSNSFNNQLSNRELKYFEEMILDNIHLVRETCHSLKPAFLKELGIVESLKNLINKFQIRENLNIIHYFDDIDNLSDDLSVNLYRIVQELLNNAVKHSKATQISISLQCDESKIILSYKDNGVGFSKLKERNHNAIGLSSIKERTQALNGNITFKSIPQQGLNVVASFPFNNPLKVGVNL
ncbi:sensor histidine kinase [Priestia aryabhattai]|uniref:sensor histidine kinase n=1 Tax=Priestia aryabhattai TaxID=412384 RepID=UPI001CFD0713|nr:ATP-binding protein [Priestia aryabhattai]